MVNIFMIKRMKGGDKMNKGLIIASVFFVALALVLVSAEGGDGNGPGNDDAPMLISGNPNSGNAYGAENGSGNPALGREIRGFAYGISKMKNIDGDEMEIERDGGMKLRIRNVTAHSEFNITGEDDEMNRTRLKIHFPNGANSEIKIMPSTASERALERLRLHACNESNNCTIQLKATGKGNETRAMYEVQAERHFKLFGLFERKAQVRAQVDAETGDISSVGKPWWSFLASQPAE